MADAEFLDSVAYNATNALAISATNNLSNRTVSILLRVAIVKTQHQVVLLTACS